MSLPIDFEPNKALSTHCHILRHSYPYHRIPSTLASSSKLRPRMLFVASASAAYVTALMLAMVNAKREIIEEDFIFLIFRLLLWFVVCLLDLILWEDDNWILSGNFFISILPVCFFSLVTIERIIPHRMDRYYIEVVVNTTKLYSVCQSLRMNRHAATGLAL